MRDGPASETAQAEALEAAARGEVAFPKNHNEVWAMDFVHDSLVDGRRVRAITTIDPRTRESPWIEVGGSILGD